MWRFRTILMLGLAGLLLVSVPPARATDEQPDEQPPAVRSQRDDDQRERRGRRHHRGRGLRHLASRPFEEGCGIGLGRNLFRIAREDRAPLEPGETEELLAFAKEHFPRLHRLMERVQRRNPEMFRAKLAENAPKLRHLRRVYERSPALGRIIHDHARTGMRLREYMRTVHRQPADAELHTAAMQAARETLAETVRLEIEALRTLHDLVQTERSERVEERLDCLLSDDFNLAAAPPRLRELLETYQEADAATQARIRDHMTTLIDERITVELKAMEERAAQMEDNAAEEVDRRLERLREHRGRQRGEGDRPYRRHRPRFRADDE